MKKRLFWTLFKYGLGFVLLAFVISTNWEGIKQALQNPVRIAPFLAAIVICTGSLLLTFVRWFILVRAQGLPFTFGNAIRLGLIGQFLSTFLPGSVGGDIIKAAFIAREQSRRTVAVATVLFDRALGLWALILLVSLLGAAFWIGGNASLHSKPALQLIVVIAWVLVSISGIGWFLLALLPEQRASWLALRLERIPKIGGSIAELWRAGWMYGQRRKAVGVAVLLSLVGHVGFVLTFYFAAQTFHPSDERRLIIGMTVLQGAPDDGFPSGIPWSGLVLNAEMPPPLPSLQEHFLLIPVGMTVQGLVPTPGGLGGGEYTFGGLYWLMDPRLKPSGVVGSMGQRMIFWGLGLIGYLIYLRMRPALQTVARSTATDQAAAIPTLNTPV